MTHDYIADLLGPWAGELGTGAVLLRIALSVLLAAVVGCERSSKRHSAGLRTFIIVSLASTTSAIVEVDPKLFTDKNIGILADILLAGAAKGLSNVQFNTIDADTLIDAKAHPEKYNNLAVRVSGFSQKFNLLSPELQDHIIGRTKHACL